MSARSDPSAPCCLCNSTEDNELQYGKFYECDGIVTHYYCLLLSSNMEQKGKDEEGILGFLPEDIQKEVRRGKRLVCSYCRKIGATLGCCNVRCKRIFHLPCSLKSNSLHQFFGEFRSYCINHRPKQNIDDHVLKQIVSSDNTLCYICYDKVEPKNLLKTLWAPCCKKDAWFHRKCIQQLALSAGYFFKCPLCNNNKDFQAAMLEHGIFIPSQDASWELVPNAFEELLYRHNRCDAVKCLCPKGRKYTSSNAKWELALCRTCGSQGIHMICGQLKWANPMWECAECTSILNSLSSNEDAESDSNSESSIQKNSNSDSDSEISVGTEYPLLCETKNFNLIPSPSLEFSMDSTVNIKLRPGPRCFKLRQLFEAEKLLEADKQLEADAILEADKQLEADTLLEADKLLEANKLLEADKLLKTDKLLETDKLDKVKSIDCTNSLNSSDKLLFKESEHIKDNKISKENISQKNLQESAKDNSQKGQSSNDEKSQPIPQHKKANVITIETDDDNDDDDDDEVQIIPFEQETNPPTLLQSKQSSTSPATLMEDSSLLNKTANSVVSKPLTIDLLKTPNNNLQKVIVLESEIPSGSKSTSLEQMSAVTPQTSLLDVMSLNSDDLEDTNADKNKSSVMNIKISNVTSLPAEVFESVPDIMCEGVKLNINSVRTLHPGNGNGLKAAGLHIPKRNMYEEESNAVKNCKKIKVNDLDKKFSESCTNRASVIVPNINQRTNGRISPSKSTKICEDNHDLSFTSVSTNRISNLSQNNGLPSQMTSFQKADIRYANQTESNSVVESGDAQQSKESSVNMTTFNNNPIYVHIPQKRENIYCKPILNTNLTTNQTGINENVYNVQSSDAILPQTKNNYQQVITNVNNNQIMLVTQSTTANSILPTTVNKKTKNTLVKQKIGLAKKIVPVSTIDNNSPSYASCDGDVGTDTGTSSTDEKDDPFGESCGSADDANCSQILATTRGVFPQVTNNHNTCHPPRLTPQYMDLRNLKFRVCESGNIQMILYDTFSVNIPVDQSKKRKIRPTSLTTPEVKRLCTPASRSRSEASSSFDYSDGALTATQCTEKVLRFTRNENYSINDKTKCTTCGRDEAKENLDPVKSKTLARRFGNNLTSETDDMMIKSYYTCGENDGEICVVSSDNPSALNRMYCSVDNVTDDVGVVSNDRNQNLRINAEAVKQPNQASSMEERNDCARSFCKELIHNFDLNVINANKNAEKVLPDNITVSTKGNQHVDDDRIIDDHTFDTPRSWNNNKHLDRTNIRLKAQNQSVAQVSEAILDEHTHKQIDVHDSRKFIRCRSLNRSCINDNSDNRSNCRNTSFKISIELNKIQNLISTKPELFVNEKRNNKSV